MTLRQRRRLMTRTWCLVQALLRLCRHAAGKHATHGDVQTLDKAACWPPAGPSAVACLPTHLQHSTFCLHSITIAPRLQLACIIVAGRWELQEFKAEQQRAADAAAASGSISEDWGLSQVRVFAAELALCSVQMGQVSGCTERGSAPEGLDVLPLETPLQGCRKMQE